MEDLKELEPKITDQLAAIQDKLKAHKRRKALKEKLDQMQNPVDRLLLKAAAIGMQLNENYNEERKPEKKDPATLIDTIRRGWAIPEETSAKAETEEPTQFSIDSNVVQMNGDNPETNA